MATTPGGTSSSPGLRLRRSLTLWDLILYGIIVIQPTAPMPAYGVFSNAGQGHVVTSILIAMIAMVFTAMSYGRMARVYPSAGSAYTYVGRELHPSLGYVTGWSMTMDYMLNPLICTIWCSKAMADLLTGTRYQIPYPGLLWPIIFALLFTALNLRGVKTSGPHQSNPVRDYGRGDSGVLLVHDPLHFPFAAISRSLLPASVLQPGNFHHQPGVFHGTSVAVLTYIGFDGISTLSEEVDNPKRNIFLATVLVCVVTGFLAAAEVYGAQLLSLAISVLGGRSGERIQPRGRDRGRPADDQSHQHHAADCDRRFRHGIATGRGTPALWHGTQRRHSRRNSLAPSIPGPGFPPTT